MLKKLEKTWKDLDRSIIVNKRELVLGACTLAGIVLGVFLSPRKNLTFGTYNDNHNSGHASFPPEVPEAEVPEQEAGEA